jgi:2Fe-2S ferredoxin
MSLFKRTPKPTANVTYISWAGETREIAVPIGNSVMEGAVNNSIDGIVAECGGACMCATCHVYVDEAFLSKLEPIKEDEDEMLNNAFAGRKPNSRLGCQIKVTEELDGLIVRTPEAQL